MRAIMPDRHRDRDRAASALGVALVHGLLGYVLLAGLAPRIIRLPVDALTAFDLAAPAPPEVSPPKPAERRVPRAEAMAAPPAARAEPVPVVAPTMVPPVPPPVVAAPVAAQGTAARSGAAAQGEGTGAAGEGAGRGAGGGGDGTGGGGGLASRARLLAGRIVARDFPERAARAGARGSVTARFVVDAAGRVRDCRVAESSGHAALDEATCRLITQRFRYAPARDGAGRAVAEPRGWRQDWWFE